MNGFKYNVGDKVKVLKATKSHWWYSKHIGREFIITACKQLGDGPNYSTGDGLLLEADIELVASHSKTLAQVKAEVAALDAQETGAHAALATTLKSIAEHREKLRVELAGFGLAPLSSVPVEAPKPQTMRELYYAEQIFSGDVFTFIGPVDSNRMWVIGQNYRIDRVDSDESVLTQCILDEDDYSWAWENEGAFDKFVKAA